MEINSNKEKIHELNKEINNLTTLIEEKYPELYQYLEENPITISQNDDPNVDSLIFQDYLETLQELIENHKSSHNVI